MNEKQTYSIEMSQAQRAFLDQMVNDYALMDVSKAVRILVDYAQDQPDQRETIFQEIRCLEC